MSQGSFRLVGTVLTAAAMAASLLVTPAPRGAIAAEPREANGPSPSADALRAAHQEMLSWFDDSDNDRRWVAYLQAPRLAEQLERGARADKQALREILDRYEAGHPGLELPQIHAVRVALALWLDDLTVPTLADLPKALRDAGADFVPPREEELRPLAQAVRQAISQLDAYLGTDDNALRWKRYLQLESLQAQVDGKAKADLAILNTVLERFSANHEGLELPEFTAVRDALARYLRPLRLASEPGAKANYAKHLDSLAAAVQGAARGDDPAAVRQIADGLAWLEERCQAPQLTRIVRRHFAEQLGGIASVAATPRPRVRPKPVRVMSAAKDQLLRQFLPAVDDPALERVLRDPTLILYTEAEVPKAYQIWDGQLQGVHLASYNISADGGEPYGNGNYEFPWGTPAGTHRANNVSSFRFLWLPRDRQGRLRPIVWYEKYIAGDSRTSYAWSFPVGAIVGEVLMLKAPGGFDYTFEMRLRFRQRDAWSVDVFRPFPTAEHLARRIRELRPNVEAKTPLAELLRHLEEPLDMSWKYLADRHPSRQSFTQWMAVDTLPDIGDDHLVVELLTKTTFTSSLDQTWRAGQNGTWTFAPTTQANFHVVPANYDAGFVEVNRKSCLRCHDNVNQPVSRFHFGRDWYGHVRGSDGIFSFHPFEPSSLSGNGFGNQGAAMRRELTDAGVVERFDSDKHPASAYTQLPEIEG
jgi:hypothetical protein